jgi:hypothetical protein
MKISGYYKGSNHNVELITDYSLIGEYDKLYISKVFSDTHVPEEILKFPNVYYGGTGFFYDNAPNLPDDIEHHMPDYHLYDSWVNDMITKGYKRTEFEYYLDYSIGFMTRGCFRKCSFCVNKKYNKVQLHSPVSEFLDISRKYICLLDDNVLGFGNWEQIVDNLIATKKYFQFKQGMDIRIMTDKKAEKLSKVKYLGDYIFAFDHIDDAPLIEQKLQLWRKYCKVKSTKLYVLCAYDEKNTYTDEFWVNDIKNTFKRMFVLAKHDCLPYIMRYEKYENSPYRGMYVNLAAWGNQPNFFKKMSFKEFCIGRGMKEQVYHLYKHNFEQYLQDGYNKGAAWVYMDNFEREHESVARQYYDIRYSDCLLN